ncbi:4-aminobutyrate--2-oxoglutarate transaminase [Luteimonas sp. MC1572]|uniref:4-aminobutyrate--2-oxoglutarate transaminase n=1 Tax=Luteimonas sp. MC1572 TaxID=2799325 RepID=UPI0018F09815|nr:4-aminobutyrate--2-oxoglutarate transaminase [Luteimonas sp. MC1572]QQO03142.1 4-aminobutyrate--2-oxoglutarate transaminase [Luteimonas sp. MC1572]
MTDSTRLQQRRMAAIPRGVATAMTNFAERAENAELWDTDGQRFVDFAGGIAVLNVGHRHPKVMAAVRDQLDRYTHTAFQVMAYEPYVALAERLNALAPIDGPAKTILFSTGAEAVENAVKIARAATGRRAVIAFSGGFHGRSFMAMAMTGKTVPYKRGFGPLPGDVHHLPFPAAHRGGTVEESLAALDSLFRTDVSPEDVAAIVIEPVQGEGGFLPAPAGLMRALREIADAHGIALVADEVQTGFGRTGRMFGIEHSDVRPDLMVVAKSLAGGFPLSGVIGRAALMDAAEPGGLGGTYAGSPIACAAALAVLDVIEEEGLLERARVLGERVLARLAAFAQRDDLRPVGNVRGLGSMLAFDLLARRGDAAPDPAATRAVLQRAHALGLVLLGCGGQGESIRLLYPLTISDGVFDEGMALLEQALLLPSDAAA